MARTTVPVTTAVRAGVALVGTAVLLADGGKFENAALIKHLIVINPTMGSLTFTPVFGKNLDGKTPTADAVTVGAGVTKVMAPYPAEYNQQSGADANFVYFAVSADGLTFATLES